MQTNADFIFQKLIDLLCENLAKQLLPLAIF